MLPGPAGNVIDEVDRVGIPTTLFCAPFVQQLKEPVDLLTNADPKYHSRDNNAHQDQDCGSQCCQIPVVDESPEPYIEGMKHNRNHHRQKNRIQQRSRNQITEVESDCG